MVIQDLGTKKDKDNKDNNTLTCYVAFQHVPLLVGSAMKVNRVFFIAPEPFELQRANGEAVSIAPPCSWSGLAPVQVRLLSSEWREGQVCITFFFIISLKFWSAVH